MCPRRTSRGGFTLLEILLALVVLSAGVTIFISLFTGSLALAQSNRNQSIAASLAEEQMTALVAGPSSFDWHQNEAAVGQLTEITVPGEPEKPRHCLPPSILPIDKKTSVREAAVYEAFTWQAFSKLPRVDAANIEVTVVIRWVEAGRPCLFALTSSVARSRIATGASGVRAEGST